MIHMKIIIARDLHPYTCGLLKVRKLSARLGGA
jgi:hypothetical protein